MEAQSTLEKTAEPTSALAEPLMLPRRAEALLRLSLRANVAAVVTLLAAAFFVFRYPVFYGYRFIGNSDRWDQYLLFAQLHADALSAGSFRSWSEYLLGGFDPLAQAFSFFSPLFLIAPLLR